MSSDFNWQTDEEDWGREAAVEERGERPNRRWWPAAVVIVLVVGVIGFLVYRQVQRQIAEAVALAESDIRRTHELVLQAAERRDRDLLQTMISSRDNDWKEQQLDLAEEGLLYNPRPFGLVAQGEGEPEYEFEISADLSAAEVVITRSFTVQSATGVSETVSLKQQALYRRGQDRWLYSPPLDEDSFWREEASTQGRYVAITYPQRDAAEVELLLDYLDETTAEMCSSLPDFSCPDDLHIVLELTTDPGSLSEMQDVEVLFENSSSLRLPTISLVGLPADEAAREALHRVYAVQVIRKAMIHALDWECCLQGLFFRALLDYQLAELGVKAYPMTPAEYERLFSQFQNIETFDEFWRLPQIELVDRQTWQWPYAVTEFLLSTTLADRTAGELQQSLLVSGSYVNWVAEALTISIVDVSVRQAWLNFIYNSSLSGRVAVGSYAPEEDILLACQTITSPRTRLHRYDWVSEQWVEADRFEEALFYVDSLPDDSAVVVQNTIGDEPGSTYMWENGRKRLLLDGTNPEQAGYYFIGSVSPNGRKLLMVDQIQDEIGYYVLDLDECENSDCRPVAVPGFPQWSPDSSQFLLDLIEEVNDVQTVFNVGRVDEDGNLFWISENSYSPFWLGDDEYGFIRFVDGSAIYGASTADDEPYLLLKAEDLLPFVAETERPESLVIERADPNPANRNIIAITTIHINGLRPSILLFYWNRATGEIKHHSTIEAAPVGQTVWLPGGEWLVLGTFRGQQPSLSSSMLWTYYLVNISGETQPMQLFRDQDLAFPFFDRTVDGNWLVISHPDYLEVVGMKHLVVDNRPYRRLLAHNFTNCRNALFIW